MTIFDVAQWFFGIAALVIVSVVILKQAWKRLR
jgi:hypothetical protein